MNMSNNNIAIIPARSGSKGLPNKNILPIDGKPMLSYTVEAAISSGLFTKVHVSTDSEEYANIARKYGADVPFLRSKEMSSDMAGSWDVVLEVLSRYREMNFQFDTVCLLQPTSPLRGDNDIKGAYLQYSKCGGDSMTSVSEVDHSPLWTMTLDDSLSLEEYKKRRSSAPRQLLEKYYRINGAIYIRKISNGKEITICNEMEYAYIMPKEKSIDIDDEYDLVVAKALFDYNRHK